MEAVMTAASWELQPCELKQWPWAWEWQWRQPEVCALGCIADCMAESRMSGIEDSMPGTLSGELHCGAAPAIP